MHVILTHLNADFDALASLVAAHKLYPDAQPILPAKLNRNVYDFVMLYQNGLPARFQRDLTLPPATRITLVDTQTIPPAFASLTDVPLLVIDHHPRWRPDAPNQVYIGALVGANATLLIEQLRANSITLSSLEATTLALGIYEDTGALTYTNTTPRDILAAAWLLEQGAVLDTVRRFLAPPLATEQQALYDELLPRVETRMIGGYPLMVAAIEVKEMPYGLSAITRRLNDALDPTALAVVVHAKRQIVVVLRADNDAVNVAALAEVWGGGGHARAAAVTIKGAAVVPLGDFVARLWAWFEQHTQPAVRVAELMSHGVQTVNADDTIGAIIHRIRQIGHEGYPVLQAGALVGLLTRRDADRASEHGLDNTRVGEVMNKGVVSLTPSDSVYTLEQTMVESAWGQIPVINAQQAVIGIVTRTDLIKHWARIHRQPRGPTPAATPELDLAQVEAALGAAVRQTLERVAAHAAAQGITAYLVGGVVRDLLLGRPNDDIDFVIEGDAAAFAQGLAQQHGGQVVRFAAFGTAKWAQTDGSTVDFATARYEFYTHPTALPTVYSGSIKLDMARRDFAINAIALELHPQLGRVLDFHGGRADLAARQVRVLHNLSFVDDPTRILRAVRFAHRLDFALEARTAELLASALPMLRRISGDRLRNEFALLFAEPLPERALWRLRDLDVLSAIHPAWVLRKDVRTVFPQVRAAVPPDALTAAYWLVLLSALPAHDSAALCERLNLGAERAAQAAHLDELAQVPPSWFQTAARSQIVARVWQYDALTLQVAACLLPHAAAALTLYHTTLRHIQPLTKGDDLKALGLPPSPRYKQILQHLRAAWLDGEVTNAAEEQALLAKLIR
jgi:tRNA nucleotidyltransferase (CCA-adding enzyme)